MRNTGNPFTTLARDQKFRFVRTKRVQVKVGRDEGLSSQEYFRWWIVEVERVHHVHEVSSNQ